MTESHPVPLQCISPFFNFEIIWNLFCYLCFYVINKPKIIFIKFFSMCSIPHHHKDNSVFVEMFGLNLQRLLKIRYRDDTGLYLNKCSQTFDSTKNLSRSPDNIPIVSVNPPLFPYTIPELSNVLAIHVSPDQICFQYLNLSSFLYINLHFFFDDKSSSSISS